MKKLIFLASFVSALMVTEFANAQARLNNHNQQVRIQQGVRHGQLTPREAQHLRAQQQRIKAMKRVAKADGRVTPRERMMIRNAEKRSSVAIYNQKHDRNTRW